MSFEYAPPRDDDELNAFATAAMQALHPSFPGDADWFEKFKRRLGDQGNARIVHANGAVVGGLVDQIMDQWFGGARIPISAVSAVAIAPEYRGQGAATVLMRGLVREVYETKSRPLAALYPATQPLYRKIGFELAGALTTWELPSAAFRGRTRALTVRPITAADQPTLTRLYAHRAARTTGHLERNAWMWGRVLEPPRDRGWGFLFEHAGVAEGYVVYLKKPNPEMRYELWLNDFVATTPRAYQALLTFLAEHASMAGKIGFHGAPTEPLLALLDQQTELACRHRIDWMLRLVDLPRALEARGYPKALRGELHLSVDDDLIPENKGNYVLTIDGGHARVKPGGRGDLRLHVRPLATMYSGYLSARDLSVMGKIEGDAESLALADAIFAGPPPWMPDMF